MKKKLITSILLMVILTLTACGVSKSDYEDLEARVSKLEKQLNGDTDDDKKGKATTTPRPTTADYIESAGVYELSDRTVDEIVDEIVRFMTSNMSGKTPEQFTKELNLRYYPDGNANLILFTDIGSQYLTFAAGDGDCITALQYGYVKNMDGTLDKTNFESFQLTIIDFGRAEKVFDGLCDQLFDGASAKKEGSTWVVSRGNSSISMSNRGTSYTISATIDFWRTDY